ncbi:MAG: glycosyltransferase family 1 protein [Leptolyngbya sp. PLA1]|nr:glycosyltransferase family 1 protein [Leptolyngbya sp. PLA1]
MLFTDTLADVNGVSRFVRNIAAAARGSGREFRAVTSTIFTMPEGENLVNLPPRFSMALPGYPDLQLALPPVRRLIALAREFRPHVIHVSTPGPVGIAGRLAARSLRAPLVGVYHTDFPAYVDHLFGHPSLTCFAEAFMRRFYRGFSAVFARSEDYASRVRALGLPESSVIPLRPGVRTSEFHPRFRSQPAPDCLAQSRPAIRVLYAGRLSVEKNLPLLALAWRAADAALRARALDAELVVVGDGPYRASFEHALAGSRFRFTGFLQGEPLCRAYAHADLFVFPSATDTLGQVVMEAQASGVPVLVSDVGGPREVVSPGITGLVLPASDHPAWARAITDLAADRARRERMGRAAHAHMAAFDMQGSFEHFWSVHERVAADLTPPRPR